MTTKYTYVVPLVLASRELYTHNRIMKHAFSFLAGVLLVSLCVVATRSLPGWMFLLGYILSLTSISLLCRAIGFNQVARLFSSLDGFRLAPHRSSGTKRLSKTGVPGSHGYTSSPVSRQVAAPDGYPVTPWVGDPCETAESGITGDNPARQYGRRTQELPARRYSRSARNEYSPKNGESSVQSPSNNMLSTVQQDVLSALINLKVPFAHAEEAVHAAAKEHGGESFDALFRTALSLVTAGAGKSRRVTA